MSEVDEVRYEREGVAAVVTIDRSTAHGRRSDGGGAARRLPQLRSRRRARCSSHRRGDVAFCAGGDLKAIETFGPGSAA